MKTNTQQTEPKSPQKIYQQRLGFLMERGKGQVCALYVDVTEDRVLGIWSKRKKLLEEDARNLRTIEWLQKYIYTCIEKPEDLQEFQEEFRRKWLLDQFEKGRTQFVYHHTYRDEEHQIKLYKVEVTLVENPLNGHIEMYAIWSDDTDHYIDKKIRRILYQSDYIALGLINLSDGQVYMRTHQFKHMQLALETLLSYERIAQQVENAEVAPKNRKQFHTCTALPYLLEKMNIAGQYSFNVRDIDNNVQRYNYYWFDKENKVLLFVIEDLTNEMETDPVTGLMNREGFSRAVDKILKEHPQNEFVMLYFNVHRFKSINDLYGYEAGDIVLQEGANALRTSSLCPLAIARTEADHFVMLIEKKNMDTGRLMRLLHRVYEKGELKTDIYGRCGIYYIPKDCKLSVSDICDRAKLAKESISNQYVQPYAVYQEDMSFDYEQKSLAVARLDDALAHDEIKVYYQPIYDACTHRIVSAEALVRWISEKNGVILPGKFIPALEESGHITKLDTFVQKSVQKLQKRHWEEGLPIVRIAVNLSRMDLMDENIMNLIEEDLQSAQFPKDKISYEVTESAYTILSEAGIKFLSRLHNDGIKLLVDDFGSGFSSFSTIRDYDFDIIKLDMGFVQKLGENKKTDNIVISLIELAHRLDMKVVAEGVETKEQADFLQQYGCDYLQGYYFSKPLPQEEFEKLLAADSQIAAS